MKRNTKSALLFSVVSIIICCTMLLGTTMAWFTDSVTSAKNVIVAGNLDVELYHEDDKVDANYSVFPEADAFLWEPGAVIYENLRIENEGNLALKYQLSLSDLEATETPDGKTLKDVIKVGIVEGGFTAADANVDDRTEAINAVNGAWNDFDEFFAKGELLADDDVATTNVDEDTDVYGIVLYWAPSDNDNDYNMNNDNQNTELKLELGVVLVATQLTYENDSFNNQYDKDSEFVVEVKNADELANALNAGGLVKLANDISGEDAFTVPAGVAVTLNMNGKTITGTKGRDADNNRIHVIVNNGILTIKDGTVKSAGNDGGSAIYNNAGATLTIEDVALYGAPQSDPVYEAGVSKPFPSYAVNNYGNAVVNGATVKSYHGAIATGGDGVTVINDADIDVGLGQSTGITSYIIYSYEDAQVTVNNGKFAFTKQEIYVNGGNTFCELGTYPIIVNGGNYTGTSFSSGAGREYVIKGGTFDANPSAYVANGYQAVDNGDGTWTVKGYDVSNATELTDAIANGKAVELTQDVTLGKIDLTNAITNDVVIDANGHKITTNDAYGIEVTAGKNVTISNADVQMTKAGDYITYAAGFKIANGDYAGSTITLKNCTITMANADWAYAVNMPASVKNLNLVIDKCTLEGAIAVQCWGDNNTITITNSKLICNYTTNAQYTSYCVALQEDGTTISENNKLVIDNCEFQYSGIDNFNSKIKAFADVGSENNTITVTNCTYGEKISF